MISYEEYRDNLDEEELKKIIGDDNYYDELYELAEEWFLEKVTDKDSREFIKYCLDVDIVEDYLTDSKDGSYTKFYDELKEKILEDYEEEIGEDYDEYVADEKNEEYLYNEWKMSR